MVQLIEVPGFLCTPGSHLIWSVTVIHCHFHLAGACDRSDYWMCSKYDMKERTVILTLMGSALLAKAIWGDLGKRSFLRLFGESVEETSVNRGAICLHLLIRLCFLKSVSTTWLLLKPGAGLLTQDYFNIISIFKPRPSCAPVHLSVIRSLFFCCGHLKNVIFWGVRFNCAALFYFLYQNCPIFSDNSYII